MKILLALLPIVILITGCTPSYESADDDLKLPPEMSDCRSFLLKDSSGSHIYAIRCPNSTTTTTKAGKYPTRAVVSER
jgi:hypothetical protein